MGDTGAQIRQWFNYPNGTSDYLRLLNPNVLLNGHHPVVHTAIIGSCVQLGLSLFNSANAGLAIYTCAQFVITAACMAYSISSLRKLGVSLPIRGVILLFFVFMPMFSNYAALLTKDVLFADAFLVLSVQTVKLVACGLPRRDANAERAGEQRPVLFARHDWLLLALGAMGSTFLRNGGLVSPGGMRNRGGVLRMGRACGSSCSQAGRCCAFGAISRFRWVGVLAVLGLCLASNMYFTKVFMPAHDITTGSKRELLSLLLPADGSFRPKARRPQLGCQPYG